MSNYKTEQKNENYIFSMLLLSLLLIACTKTTASSEIDDTTGNFASYVSFGRAM